MDDHHVTTTAPPPPPQHRLRTQRPEAERAGGFPGLAVGAPGLSWLPARPRRAFAELLKRFLPQKLGLSLPFLLPAQPADPVPPHWNQCAGLGAPLGTAAEQQKAPGKRKATSFVSELGSGTCFLGQMAALATGSQQGPCA